MNFNNLDNDLKKSLHEEITAYADSIGGKNFFLQLIEHIKADRTNLVLSKTGTFHFPKGKVCFSKSIYKDTYKIVFDAIRREEKNGDMLDGINPKDYKAVMNMMRALSSTTVEVVPKEESQGEGFSFNILDTSVEKKTKFTFIFKILFFYNIEEAKKALSYEP